MNDDVLDRAQELLDGVYDGPWEQVGFGNICAEGHPRVAKTWNRANGDFIAASRTLVPQLADALRAARTENERLRADAADLIERLERASIQLDALAQQAHTEIDRLKHKRQGVDLALSYAREYQK